MLPYFQAFCKISVEIFILSLLTFYLCPYAAGEEIFLNIDSVFRTELVAAQAPDTLGVIKNRFSFLHSYGVHRAAFRAEAASRTAAFIHGGFEFYKRGQSA